MNRGHFYLHFNHKPLAFTDTIPQRDSTGFIQYQTDYCDSENQYLEHKSLIYSV